LAAHLPGDVADAGLELVVLEVESPTLSLRIPPRRRTPLLVEEGDDSREMSKLFEPLRFLRRLQSATWRLLDVD
jgi:hypothetical protein